MIELGRRRVNGEDLADGGDPPARLGGVDLLPLAGPSESDFFPGRLDREPAIRETRVGEGLAKLGAVNVDPQAPSAAGNAFELFGCECDCSILLHVLAFRWAEGVTTPGRLSWLSCSFLFASCSRFAIDTSEQTRNGRAITFV